MYWNERDICILWWCHYWRHRYCVSTTDEHDSNYCVWHLNWEATT